MTGAIHTPTMAPYLPIEPEEVEKMVRIAREFGYDPCTPDEARAAGVFLGGSVQERGGGQVRRQAGQGARAHQRAGVDSFAEEIDGVN